MSQYTDACGLHNVGGVVTTCLGYTVHTLREQAVRGSWQRTNTMGKRNGVDVDGALGATSLDLAGNWWRMGDAGVVRHVNQRDDQLSRGMARHI